MDAFAVPAPCELYVSHYVIADLLGSAHSSNTSMREALLRSAMWSCLAYTIGLHDGMVVCHQAAIEHHDFDGEHGPGKLCAKQVCQSGEGSDASDMAKPARQLESLALQAVAAVPSDAEAVWLVAFERLTAMGSSSKKLTQALLQRLTGQRKGPLRVSSP